MPTPRKGETKKEWMDRCIPVVIREGKDPDEAAGQCAGMWERRGNVQHCECKPGQTCSCGQLSVDLTPAGMTRVTMVAHQDGAVRREVHDGRDHLVVPVVAVVEGVLNGHLVLASEFAKQPTLSAWNGVPVPINHPTDPAGNPISANSPEVVENAVIGRLYRVHVEQDKLKGEIWIDVEKAKRLGYEEVVTNLEAGEPMEVSTGYFAEVEPKPGVHANEQYVGVHRNIAPDHLALLPNDQGACSWGDGCGAPRTHNRGEDTVLQRILATFRRSREDNMQTHQGRLLNTLLNALGFVANATSLTDRISEVMQAVDRAAAGDRFRFTLDVMDDDTVVFEEEGVLMRQSFEVGENGQVTLTGSPEEVRLEKRFVPVNQPAANRQEETTVNDADDKGGLSPEQAQTIANAERVVEERRQEYIDGIKANKANPYSDEELKAMSFDRLRDLYRFAKAKPAEDGGGDYSHRGGPAPQVHAEEVEPLAMPEAG